MFGASEDEKAYFGPFAVFIAGEVLLEVVSRFFEGARPWVLSHPQYWVFPLETFLAAWLLLLNWRRYSWGAAPRPWLGLAFGLGIGVIVCALWVAPGLWWGEPRIVGFQPEFFSHPVGAAVNLALRTLRLVVVVPLAEEIFWRGFLLRYLVDPRFTRVPFGTFAWKAFALTTAGFCLEHRPADWAAALVTGALYNWVAIRTRSLAACVASHSVTNLLLGAYVLWSHEWGYW